MDEDESRTTNECNRYERPTIIERCTFRQSSMTTTTTAVSSQSSFNDDLSQDSKTDLYSKQNKNQDFKNEHNFEDDMAERNDQSFTF